MHTRVVVLTAGLAALALGACAHAPVIPPRLTAPGRAASSPVIDSFGMRTNVPAGSLVRIALDEDVTSTSTAVGHEFTGHVLSPMLAENGRVVVETGSMVQGRVVAIEPGSSPWVKLAFDSIDTVRGPTAMHATIDRSTRFAAADATASEHPASSGFDVLLAPAPARGGGPSDYDPGAHDGPSRDQRVVELPAESVLTLHLTRALRL